MEIVEELKRLKSLLDEGAITSNEFNELKKNVIDGQASNIVAESKSYRKEQPGNKKSKSLLRSTLLFSLLTIVPILIIFGIINFDSIKQQFSTVSKIQDSSGRRYAYEDGKQIGVIVTMEVKTSLANTGGSGLELIKVPHGKMWTPLYYELRQGSEKYPTIYFFPLKTAYGFLKSEAYLFDVTKERFVSYKYSKQNHQAFAGQGDAAVVIPSYSPTSTYLIYFLEE